MKRLTLIMPWGLGDTSGSLQNIIINNKIINKKFDEIVLLTKSKFIADIVNNLCEINDISAFRAFSIRDGLKLIPFSTRVEILSPIKIYKFYIIRFIFFWVSGFSSKNVSLMQSSFNFSQALLRIIDNSMQFILHRHDCKKKLKFSKLILHPGCEKKSKFKRWPISKYIELYNHLILMGFKVDFIVGPDEYEFIPILMEHKIPYVAPKGAKDLISEISEASILVGNDSGLTHLAAFLNVSVISIFGPSDPGQYAPISNQGSVYIIESGNKPDCAPCIGVGGMNGCNKPVCMDGIAIEEVLSRIKIINKVDFIC